MRLTLSQEAQIKVRHRGVMPKARSRLCSSTMAKDEGSSCRARTPPRQAASLGQVDARLPSDEVSSCRARTPSRQAANFGHLGAHLLLPVLCFQLRGNMWQVTSQQGYALTWVGMQAPRYCS